MLANFENLVPKSWMLFLVSRQTMRNKTNYNVGRLGCSRPDFPRLHEAPRKPEENENLPGFGENGYEEMLDFTHSSLCHSVCI